MAITALEARRQIVDDLAAAVDQLALALACLGEAYELVDEETADRLEAQLFRPLQRAYATAKRTDIEFAERHGLGRREFSPATPGLSSQGVKSFVERAVAASGDADRRIAMLQDTMLPIESGDADLRAGLAEARELLDEIPGAARQFLRTLGR